jgi:cobalamin biosynthesis protein CobT
MDALILIDKINLYFKAGFNCGVKFTSEEKPFVVRAEKTETVDDVIQLAQEIYEFSKDQVKKRKEKISQDHEEQDDEDLEDEEYGYDDDDIDGESDYDDDDFDEDGLEDEEDDFKDHREKRGAGGRSEDKQEAEEAELEQQLESKTEEMFSKKLEELADESTVYNYYNLDEKYTFNPIISYKKIIAETASVDEELTEYDLKELVQFKTDSSRVVNYLVKEFEMRKSATLYKRAQTSKIGSLDMKKVWAYKLNDDIFKRVTTLPIGKNHGMIFLLDWSGSMDHVLRETVQQVINLAMFCQRAQIPYQVFAFTTQYDVLSKEEECALSNVRREFYEQNKKLSNAVTAFGLMELFSSKMSNVEFNIL